MALRNPRGCDAASNESNRAANPGRKPRQAQHDEIAGHGRERERQHASERAVDDCAILADAPHHRSCNARADEVAGGVDRVHEPGGRIGPAEAGAHVRQQQRIGETSDSDADCRRQCQNTYGREGAPNPAFRKALRFHRRKIGMPGRARNQYLAQSGFAVAEPGLNLAKAAARR
jgi:hypothetical protein